MNSNRTTDKIPSDINPDCLTSQGRLVPSEKVNTFKAYIEKILQERSDDSSNTRRVDENQIASIKRVKKTEMTSMISKYNQLDKRKKSVSESNKGLFKNNSINLNFFKKKNPNLNSPISNPVNASIEFSGVKLGNRYFAIAPLKGTGNKMVGEGYYGKVKLLQDIDTGDWLVIKKRLIQSENAETATAVLKELKKEFTLLHALYPTVPDPEKYEFEVMTDKQGKQYVYGIMPYFPGKSLNEYLRNDEKLKQERFDIAIAMIDAYIELHEKGILHIDIKLENMIYDADSKSVKIVDTGLSERADNFSPNTKSPLIVQFNSIKGTPHTFAPEHFTHLAPYTYNESTECFALGIELARIYGFDRGSVETKPFQDNRKGRIDRTELKNASMEEGMMAALINKMIDLDLNSRPTLQEVRQELNMIARLCKKSIPALSKSVPLESPAPEPEHKNLRFSVK